MITIVVPTIDGREASLDRCITSYQQHTDTDHEIIIVSNAPNCGVVWQWAAEHSTGDYIAFSADDLEAHEGWWQEATTMIDQGVLPAPLIYNPDGTIQSCGGSNELEPDHAYTDFTRAPFVSRSQWDNAIKPMIPIHYYTDNYASHRARDHGIPTVTCHSYKLTHHTADEGRGAGLSWEGRMAADHRLCLMYLRGDIPIPEGDDAWQPTPPTSASQRLHGKTVTKSSTIPAKPEPATSPS